MSPAAVRRRGDANTDVCGRMGSDVRGRRGAGAQDVRRAGPGRAGHGDGRTGGGSRTC